MANARFVTSPDDTEYDAIEAAVVETARGRWFLAEFSRRNRTADTQVLLEAIGRLEQAPNHERAARDLDRLRGDLVEMGRTISRAKTEVAALRPDDGTGQPISPAEALDAIVRTTEQATSDILEAAEQVQEAAWTLREGGADPHLCEELDRRATAIYTACSFQDLTAQRTGKIVQTLRDMEARLDGMIEGWGGKPAAEQAAPPETVIAPAAASGRDNPASTVLTQGEVDSVILDDDLFLSPAPAATAALEPPPSGGQEASGGAPAPLSSDPLSSSSAPGLAATPEAFASPAAQAPEVTQTSWLEPWLAQAQRLPSPPADPLPVRDADPGLFQVGEPSDIREPSGAPLPSPPAPLLAGVADEAGVFQIEAFAEIDRLETREKLRRFT